MTTITRSQQLATTAIGIIGAMGTSGIDAASPDFTRAVAKFAGAEPVFTRTIAIRAADDASTGETGGELENVQVKDGEAFSFDAVASRGTKRLMWHPAYRRIVWEVLTITPESVDTSVVDSQRGLPFYRDHYHYYGALLGRVSSLDVTDGEIVARKIRLSRHEDVQRYRMDVADGLTSGVSLGYRHKRSELIEAGENELYPTCIVHEIIPVELSATDMPADILCGIIEASIRSASDDVPETAITGTRAADAAGITANRAENTQENGNMDTTASAPTGAAPIAPDAGVVTRQDAPVIAPAAPIAPAVDAGAVFAARASELVTIARQANLADDVLTRAIADSSITVDAFRAQAFNAIVGRQSSGVTAGNDVATRGNRRQAMIDAIVCRTTGTAPTGLATEYVRHSIADMAHESLVAAGHTIHRNDHDEIFTRTFLQTSDFGEAMLVAARTMLTTIGAQRELEYTRLAKRRDFSNFLPNKLIDVDSFPRLKLLKESGEIQAGTFGTGSSTALLKTYARSIRVTRPAMVNDGLGIFTEMMDSMGRIIPEQQNDIVFAALMIEAMKVANGQASDLFLPGVNLLPQAAGSAAVELNDDNLDKAITLMGERKRRDGTFTWVKPKFLVTGFANRAKARRLTTAIVANATGDVNLHTDLVAVLDPSLKGNSWVLMSDPQSGTAALSYGGLTGQNGPKVRPWKEVDDHDAVAAAVILDFHGTAGSSHGIAGSLDLAAYKAAKD